MSELIVGLLGFLCIVCIVISLFKSKTLPSIAFIGFPIILAGILVAGGYYSWDDIGSLIKSGFGSTGPTAALFVFNLLLTVGVIALLIKDFFPSYVPFMIGVGLAIVVNYPGCKTAEASD